MSVCVQSCPLLLFALSPYILLHESATNVVFSDMPARAREPRLNWSNAPDTFSDGPMRT